MCMADLAKTLITPGTFAASASAWLALLAETSTNVSTDRLTLTRHVDARAIQAASGGIGRPIASRTTATLHIATRLYRLGVPDSAFDRQGLRTSRRLGSGLRSV